MVRERFDGFAETTGDVEKTGSPGSAKRCKNSERPGRKLADTDAAERPGAFQFSARKAGRGLVLQPDSLQHAQMRLTRRIGVGAAAAQPPFVGSPVALFAPPAVDFRIGLERNGPVVGAVANWTTHR